MRSSEKINIFLFFFLFIFTIISHSGLIEKKIFDNMVFGISIFWVDMTILFSIFVFLFFMYIIIKNSNSK